MGVTSILLIFTKNYSKTIACIDKNCKSNTIAILIFDRNLVHMFNIYGIVAKLSVAFVCQTVYSGNRIHFVKRCIDPWQSES